MRTFCIFFLLIALVQTTRAQIALSQWRDHFPWARTQSVTKAGKQIYCATDLGIIKYDTEDNSIERLTKANALSDVGINIVRYNGFNQTVVVGYKNGNIDLLKENATVNMPEIKRDNLIGNKTIYDIVFRGKLAYIATGFGIVVIDTDKEEVADTYIIGPNESQLRVNSIAMNNAYIWAATEENGLFRADIHSPNLANFNNWGQVPDVPNVNGPFRNIISYGNRVYVKYQGNTWNSDTVYYYENDAWTRFGEAEGMVIPNMHLENDRMIITSYLGVRSFLTDGTVERNIYSTSASEIQPSDAIWDGSHFWIADSKRGLVRTNSPGFGMSVLPDGPAHAAAFDLQVYEKDVWVATGGFASGTWNTNGNFYGCASFVDGSWVSYTPENTTAIDTLSDFVSVAIDPANEKHVFVSSWRNGVVEMKNGEVLRLFNEHNSTLQYDPAWGAASRRIGVGGLAFDRNGYIWMSNTGVVNPVSSMSPEGEWESYTFNSEINLRNIRGMLVDESNYKWFINKGSGVVVFDDNGTPANKNDDRFKHLKNTTGNGGLPSNEVNCIIEDLNGEIWVGTNEGPAVFYNPSVIFSNNSTDARQILLEQDGNLQNLLETEIITCITIDGANRKWIGTRGGGVFLMSANGTEQIQAFNAANSPLISDNINDIAINHSTGEVFIATDIGIIAYQGDATGFESDYGEVYAFPNPVRENYFGEIAIRGLIRDTNVKIADVNGNLVYETTSKGGTATWNGRSLTGNRVKTGVYVVYLSNSSGDKTMVTKILFIN